MAEARLTKAARDDLRDIRTYSKAAFGPSLARQYLDGLRDAFVRLHRRPLTGAIEHLLGDDIRSLGYRSHRIYYRAASDGILIVRILHHARDVRNAFDR